ncbi:MAG TPA: cytochrome c [Bacteroidales bacterium]|nr:cytochrome c [Bacteroidales bacterium]
MKVLKALMIFAMAAFVMSACEYEWIEPDIPPIPDNVSFSADVVPIFVDDCNLCHGSGGSSPDLSPEAAYNSLTTGGYIDLETPEASLIYTSMTTGSMKSFTSPGTADIILKWIEQGAQDN